jgi:tRNA G46 methylase TrmB
VDFGCGSGALTLPLAWLFPDLEFMGVDQKASAVLELTKRALEAGLTNVRAVTLPIEHYRCALQALDTPL